MMKTNIEIEFKTAISKETYEHLLSVFDLENNVFKQTNYYFDTDDLKLNKDKVVLRIRQKGDTYYKVTMKSQHELGAYESHVVLTKEQALDMIENGFQMKDFFVDHDLFVKFKASLDNYRVSTPYENGTLFLDECRYHGITDYEIEYEVNHYEEGFNTFKAFLDKEKIPFVKSKRKSEKVLLNI